jgi:Spy/CpxP family protein refolding chaperone
LNLSEEQEASLKKISSDMRKGLITRGADLRVLRLELSDILARPDYKLEDATAKLKQIEDARLALATGALQYSAQARDILTKDQLSKLKDIRRHGRHERHCGNGRKRAS